MRRTSSEIGCGLGLKSGSGVYGKAFQVSGIARVDMQMWENMSEGNKENHFLPEQRWWQLNGMPTELEH